MNDDQNTSTGSSNQNFKNQDQPKNTINTNNDSTSTSSQNSSDTEIQDQHQQSTIATNEEYEKFKIELEQTQKKLTEMTILCQRALADLQNFKRRSEEDKANFIQFANAEIMLDLLPAINNLDRAFQHEPKDGEWIKGMEQIVKQLLQFLEKHGVKPISSLGQKFDPKLHEALMTGPGETDMVIQEFEKGYMLGEKVLKPARVKVGNGEKE